MANSYYGTLTTLAWVFGHYFYGRKHYTWVAKEYYPYRLPNPKSSNPHLIYQDLYQPWKDKDDNDKFVLQARLNLRKSVKAQENAGKITSSEARSLKKVCDKVDIVFLYPVVFRIKDINNIHSSRRSVAGSGLTAGSSEYLIKDLDESEFEIFFLDFDSDVSFQNLVIDEMSTPGLNTDRTALSILEGRC